MKVVHYFIIRILNAFSSVIFTVKNEENNLVINALGTIVVISLKFNKSVRKIFVRILNQQISMKTLFLLLKFFFFFNCDFCLSTM